jgi:hypothetical protein
MRSTYVFLFVTAFIFAVAATTAAQARCWDTGHSLRCAPGCVPTKLPQFPGDFFAWRCHHHAPPPRYAAPPPRYVPPPPRSGCPDGMYPVTPTWCCPFGTVYRNGQCRDPQPRTYEASGPHDPTVPLGILGLIILAALAWYDHHTRQVAYARETADTLEDADDIAAIARRMEAAASEADEILRQFKTRMGDDA